MNLETVDLKTLGIKGISKELLLKQLKMMYL
jgi:hypothetical protein